MPQAATDLYGLSAHAPGIRCTLTRVFRVSWWTLHALCAVAALGMLACSESASTPDQRQQPAADFYRGKTVSIVPGSGAGGGFDTTARLIARHIGKHIPVHLRSSSSTCPEAGVWWPPTTYSAPQRRTARITGLFHEAQMMNQLTGGEGVNFDLRQFSWLWQLI